MPPTRTGFHESKRYSTYALGMNRGSWMMAAWLVARHGVEAPLAVHARIMALRRALADEQQIASWLMIDDAVHELVRVKPRESDTGH